MKYISIHIKAVSTPFITCAKIATRKFYSFEIISSQNHYCFLLEKFLIDSICVRLSVSFTVESG